MIFAAMLYLFVCIVGLTRPFCAGSADFGKPIEKAGCEKTGMLDKSTLPCYGRPNLSAGSRVLRCFTWESAW
jgi:hypothetical protein